MFTGETKSTWTRAGGTLVCLNNATAVAIRQFNLPVRNVVAGLRPEEFFLRGSIVEATVEQSSPVMAGMPLPPQAALFADRSPVFETLDGFSGTAHSVAAPSSDLLPRRPLKETDAHRRRCRPSSTTADRRPNTSSKLPVPSIRTTSWRSLYFEITGSVFVSCSCRRLTIFAVLVS